MLNTSPWCHQRPHLSLASHITENIDSFRHEALKTSILSVIFISNLIQRTPCSASPCPHLNCHTTFWTLLFLLSCISICSSLLWLFLCLHMCLRNPCSILPPSYSVFSSSLFPAASALLPHHHHSTEMLPLYHFRFKGLFVHLLLLDPATPSVIWTLPSPLCHSKCTSKSISSQMAIS